MFRPSRRRRLLWPIVVTVLVFVLVAVSLGLRGDDAPAIYVEDLRDRAVGLSNKAGTFGSMLDRMGSVGRVELVEMVDDLTTTFSDTSDFLERSEPPTELAGPVAVFGVALDEWNDGITAFRDVLLRAADEPTSTGLDEVLVGTLIEIRGGDRLYTEFVEMMSGDGIPQPVAGFPAVSFLPDPYPLGAASRALVASASAEGSPLELRAALAIQQVTTDPEWVLDMENQLVVDHTETLTVKVVVANQGNTRSEPGTVSLTLTGFEGVIDQLEMPLEPLDPGGQTTVAFPALPVGPGATYQVSVALPRAGNEAVTEDNTRTLQFRVNEPTPDTTTTTTEPTTTTTG